jgi:hypothetical protein
VQPTGTHHGANGSQKMLGHAEAHPPTVRPRAAVGEGAPPRSVDWDLGWTASEREQRPPAIPPSLSPPLPSPPALSPPGDNAPPAPPPPRSHPVGLWAASGAVVVTLGAGILGIAARGSSKEVVSVAPAAALVQVCRESGRLPADGCPRVKREFSAGAAPIVTCHVHAPSPVSVCAASGFRAAPDCPKAQIRLFPFGKAPARECAGHQPEPEPVLKPASEPVRRARAAEPRRIERPAPAPRRSQPAPAAPSPRFCGVCGSAAGGRFCGSCGSKL